MSLNWKAPIEQDNGRAAIVLEYSAKAVLWQVAVQNSKGDFRVQLFYPDGQAFNGGRKLVNKAAPSAPLEGETPEVEAVEDALSLMGALLDYAKTYDPGPGTAATARHAKIIAEAPEAIRRLRALSPASTEKPVALATHHVHRGPESLPCYCAATNDHQLGDEHPDEDRELVERLCAVQHEAYERAAKIIGWETQEQSRKPWAEVPEANKATMRASIRAVLSALAAPPETYSDHVTAFDSWWSMLEGRYSEAERLPMLTAWKAAWIWQDTRVAAPASVREGAEA